ncbi:phosphatase PAP2 family protein [Telluria beijingensis]|uniref:phosphatase PAP2 family protein n=1 Tax=Telluria beijingensis TaxID=3068633 RepID=UPI002795B3A3|nr:phosphatase PAP2 family protein [Massilia sp. REN29]
MRATLLSAAALWRLTAGLAVGALAILWLGRFTNLDLALADAMFDRGAGAFPWRHAWLTEAFGHGILKWPLLLLGLGFIGAALSDLLRPSAQRSALDRLRLRVVALSAICVPAAVGTLKQLSSSHCPWDLLRYGGEQPYLRLFEAMPAGAMPGQCLPAGHASSALWLVALAVYWLPGHSARAARMALLVLVPGLALGWLQQLRGAHFLTHTLWSAWIACALALALVAMLQARAGRRSRRA